MNYTELLSKAGQVETTTGMNGYPRQLKVAYTADTMAELRALKEAAEAEGHKVEPLALHRRDGWALWERHHDVDLYDDRWTGAAPDEWVINLDQHSDPLQEVYDLLVGADPAGMWEDAKGFVELADRVHGLADELPDTDDLEGDEIIRVILDDQMRIKYAVRTGENGYTYDTHTYRSALLIEEQNEDE